jgi:4-alpha-glucanotransferase
MEKTRIIIGTHNHLPLGLDQATAEGSYQEAFKPLIAVLYRYPDFPVTLHYSGILMEWLEEFHPEFLTLLAEMVKRGQVEMLGGGYYDPILPLIPTNDKLGQLEKMTTLLRVLFETRPRGCWIAEKVWEPSLASVLRASGIDYAFLDDGQFRIAGTSETGLWLPCIAEDQGKTISLFAVSGSLSALAARAGPADTIDFLKAVPHAADGGAVAVHLDDGSAAPRTLLRNGWLEELIRRVGENAEWLEPTTPGQYLKKNPPTRRLFIPSSSSMEMMQWALPPERRGAYNELRERMGTPGAAGQFVVGGHFRQFLNRYPEAWLMYAKMINTHVLVNQVRGDKYKKKAAQNELWKGQCHHAYWSGSGGGIYENALRKAVYQSLIEAEKITRATEIFAPSIISVDYDMDNSIEYLYQGSELNAYIHSRGGAMFELDFLPSSWNYLDTMVDRENEPGEAKADGSPRYGESTPAYQRKAFIDHFFSDGCAIHDFESGSHAEAGDFLTGLYELVDLNRALPELLMRCVGSVSVEGVPRAVGIEKRFVFRPRSIDVYYRVSNQSGAELVARFGVEINISLAARSAECVRLFLLDEDRKEEIDSKATEIEGVKGLLVRDVRNEVSVTLSSARAFRCWSVPVETKSTGARAEERVFQSQCFVPQWDIRLAPGDAWENHMSVGFEKTQSA